MSTDRRATNRFHGSLLASVWISIAAGLLSNSPSYGETNQGIILVIENKVEISPVGALRFQEARTNQPLYGGDRLRTGERSRALLKLSSPKEFRVGELTTIRILAEPQERSVFNLLKGVIYFFHHDKPGEFEVRTPNVSTLIRGTEFNLQVDEDGTTTLTLVEGEVEMTNQFGHLSLKSGESAVVEPGKAPVKTAVLEAINVIQWCLYYPGVLDLADLDLSGAEKGVLGKSLSAYRSGDLLQALSEYPADRQPVSAA